MALSHRVLGSKHPFFNEDNKVYIQQKIIEVLSHDFKQRIVYDPLSITNTMQIVFDQYFESIPRMNERVVMYLCNDFRNNQIEVNKRLNWSECFETSQMVFDPRGNKGPDLQNIKLANRLGQDRVGGNISFVFF